jgi:hypothetical protein
VENYDAGGKITEKLSALQKEIFECRLSNLSFLLFDDTTITHLLSFFPPTTSEKIAEIMKKKK